VCKGTIEGSGIYVNTKSRRSLHGIYQTCTAYALLWPCGMSIDAALPAPFVPRLHHQEPRALAVESWRAEHVTALSRIATPRIMKRETHLACYASYPPRHTYGGVVTARRVCPVVASRKLRSWDRGKSAQLPIPVQCPGDMRITWKEASGRSRLDYRLAPQWIMQNPR
jgi:hypothetical protein